MQLFVRYLGHKLQTLFLLLLLRSPAISLGFTIFGWDFCVCDRFLNPTIKVVTFRLRGWCVLGVSVAGIHPPRTRTSGSFESVRWNACAHRLDLGLYSHPKEFLGGMEFEPMLTPREQSPLPENFPRGGSNPWRCGQRAQTLPTSYSGPQTWFQNGWYFVATYQQQLSQPASTVSTLSGELLQSNLPPLLPIP